MSAQLLPEEITFVQRILCSAGCYSGPSNGRWSDAVDAAEVKLQDMSEHVAAQHGTFDPRSERAIRSLHPKAQAVARQFLTAVRAQGIDVRVLSGTRTYAEQNALYRIGRFGDTRKQVTKARGGESNHNFGFAWDVGVFAGGKYLTSAAPYKQVAAHCPPGVEWGGSWKTFPDLPHYQLAVGKSLKDVRACFEGGTPFIAV